MTPNRRQLCSWAPEPEASPVLLDNPGSFNSIGYGYGSQPRDIVPQYLHQGIFEYVDETRTIVGLSICVTNPNLAGPAADDLALEWAQSDYYKFKLSTIEFHVFNRETGVSRVSPFAWAVIYSEYYTVPFGAGYRLAMAGGVYTAWSNQFRSAPLGSPQYYPDSGQIYFEWLSDYGLLVADARFELGYTIYDGGGGPAPDASLVQSYNFHGAALTLQSPIDPDQGGPGGT